MVNHRLFFIRTLNSGNVHKKMASPNSELGSYYESFITQALEKNDKTVALWSKYKNDLEVTKSLLTLISKKVTNNVMVPVGPKALMPGKVVHTNEFLVNLGETWFVKRSAHQTIEICDRRIKSCVEMLEKLGKEKELIANKRTLPVKQEAFGNEERLEIVEYVTEEDCEKWKEQHRFSEKQYKQKLAKLRKKEKIPNETEDIWKHLDELELQEELENELEMLNQKCNSSDDPEGVSKFSTLHSGFQDLEKLIKEENFVYESKNIKSISGKKQVSFASNSDSSDDEPLKLEIKHSDVLPVPYVSYSEKIISPADIYIHYKKLLNKKPISVLKHSISNTETNNFDVIKNDDIIDNEDGWVENPSVSQGAQLHDIRERNILNTNIFQSAPDPKIKKISKFKASRKKM